MARKGISLEDVQAAVNEIEKRGECVTHMAVRRELGDTGSLSTIGKHLLKIRSHGASKNRRTTDLPEELSIALTNSVSELWTHAQDIAQRDIESIRRAALEQTEELQREVEQICVSFDKQAEKLVDLEMTLEQSLARLKEAEKALVVVETEKTELEKHNTALLSRLESQTNAIEGLMRQISKGFDTGDSK